MPRRQRRRQTNERYGLHHDSSRGLISSSSLKPKVPVLIRLLPSTSDRKGIDGRYRTLRSISDTIHDNRREFPMASRPSVPSPSRWTRGLDLSLSQSVICRSRYSTLLGGSAAVPHADRSRRPRSRRCVHRVEFGTLDTFLLLGRLDGLCSIRCCDCPGDCSGVLSALTALGIRFGPCQVSWAGATLRLRQLAPSTCLRRGKEEYQSSRRAYEIPWSRVWATSCLPHPRPGDLFLDRWRRACPCRPSPSQSGSHRKVAPAGDQLLCVSGGSGGGVGCGSAVLFAVDDHVIVDW